MPFTNVTISATPSLGSGSSQLVVVMSLSEIMHNGGQTENEQPIMVNSSSGSFSINVKANDDPGTTPQDAYYTLSIAGSATPTRLAVRVPSSSPTATVSSLPIVLPSTAGARSLATSTTVPTLVELYNSEHPLVLVDQTAAAGTLLLPSAVGFVGRYTIRGTGSGSNLATLGTLVSGQTIDGAASTTVGTTAAGATWISVDLVSDGTNWRSV